MTEQGLTVHDESGRHHRNGHLLELNECDWQCLQCRHKFDAASDADRFWCGDDCDGKHPGDQPTCWLCEHVVPSGPGNCTECGCLAHYAAHATTPPPAPRGGANGEAGA